MKNMKRFCNYFCWKTHGPGCGEEIFLIFSANMLCSIAVWGRVGVRGGRGGEGGALQSPTVFTKVSTFDFTVRERRSAQSKALIKRFF